MATLRLRPKHKMLPATIWCPEGHYLYNGTALEMVQQMADEMGEEISPDQAIYILTCALAYHRQIYIGLPDVPVDDLAFLFIHALLDQGVGQPLVSAA